MKPSDDKKRLFLDMQQHPENYTDEQIEAMMAELDEPVDVEACWEEFSKKTAQKHVQTKPREKSNLLWWSSIAAAVIVLFAAWEIAQFNAYDEVQEPSTNIASNENTGNNNLVAQNTIADKTVPESKRINETVIPEKATKEGYSNKANAEDIPTPTFDKVRIRGNGKTSPDKDPVIIINGHRIQRAILDIINPFDIEDIKIIKADIAKAEYEPLYGNQVENGVIVLTLKDGTEQQYADILNPERKDKTIFSSSTETFPSFRGGDHALQEFIRENLRYPAEIPDSSITGRVAISFIVKKDGNLEDFKLIRSILKYTDGTDCKDSTIINIFTEEALRVCRLMPKWRPAVRCIDNTFQRVDWKYTISFRFAEEKEEKRIRIR